VKKVYNSLLVLLCLGFIKCAVYEDIYSDYDHSVDFSKYKTFAWLPDSSMATREDSFKNTAYDNDVIRNNAKNYINHQLVERGLQIHPKEPDALVQLILLNEKKQRVVTYADPYYPAPYYYGNTFRHYPYYYDGRTYYPYYYPYYNNYTYFGWGFNNFYYQPQTYKQTYVKGTITINLYDRAQKKLIWTASAEGDIYDANSVKEEVDPAIRKIMKTFPIKPNGKSKNNVSDTYAKR
jgi:hypothetical protein